MSSITPPAASARRTTHAFGLVLSLTLALFAAACGASEPAEPVEPAPAVEMPSEPEAPAEEEAPAEPAAPEATPADTADPAAADSGAPRTFVVVTEESSASYAADEEFFEGAVERFGVPLGWTVTIGTTGDVSGQITLDPTDPPTLVSGELRVGLGGLTSDQNRRDQQVQERLNVAQFPDAVFVPTSMDGFPAGYEDGQTVTFQLAGDLTVVGSTQPVTFDVTATHTAGRIEGQAQTSFLLSSFGIEPPTFMNVFSVEDLMTINVDLVLQEEPAATGALPAPAERPAAAAFRRPVAAFGASVEGG